MRAAGTSGRARSVLVETVLLITIAAVIALVLRAVVAQAFSIPSASMSPQLLVGDRVLVSKLAYPMHEAHRGDIVVFDCPPDADCTDVVESPALVTRALFGVLEAVGLRAPSTEEYIKRVVALPGETVEGRSGTVYVDGRRLVEPYLPAGTATGDFGPVEVPPGHLFVMGDNRPSSTDSRVFGPIPRSNVVGRTIVRVWPPASAGFL